MMSRRQTCVIAPVGGESMNKTNVMRLLDAAKITYRAKEYAYDENDLSGLHAAEGIGEPAEQIFKTLVARGEKQGYLVFCIPVCCELDLKKAAKAAKDKKVELIAVRELLPLTGYIRGGCSPIGMKKQYPTVIQECAANFDKVYVSGGRIGTTLCMAPEDLKKVSRAEYADFIQ